MRFLVVACFCGVFLLGCETSLPKPEATSATIDWKTAKQEEDFARQAVLADYWGENHMQVEYVAQQYMVAHNKSNKYSLTQSDFLETPYTPGCFLSCENGEANCLEKMKGFKRPYWVVEYSSCEYDDRCYEGGIPKIYIDNETRAVICTIGIK